MRTKHRIAREVDMARSTDLNHWARLGAMARLKEIQEELAAIYRVFPELRGRGAAAGASLRRKRFSPEGKAAISEGMRKYWARRKAAAKAAGK